MVVDKRTGWMAKLKVGDSVVLDDSGFYNDFKRIATVERITPSGLVQVKGVKYNVDGTRNGGYGFGSSYITELTDEIEREILENNRRMRYQKRIKNTNLDTLSTKQLQQIYVMIGEKGDSE